MALSRLQQQVLEFIARLLSGTERVFSLTLPDDAFRVRALRLNQVCPLEPDAAAGREATFTYRQDGWLQMRHPFGRVR